MLVALYYCTEGNQLSLRSKRQRLSLLLAVTMVNANTNGSTNGVNGNGSSASPSWAHAPMKSQERKIRVIVVGAGLSGLNVIYSTRRFMPNVEVVAYEKNGDIGGTWLENRYPGCGEWASRHEHLFDGSIYDTDIHTPQHAVCKGPNALPKAP